METVQYIGQEIGSGAAIAIGLVIIVIWIAKAAWSKYQGGK